MEIVRPEGHEIIVKNPPAPEAIEDALKNESGVVIICEDESKYSFVPILSQSGTGYILYKGQYYEIRGDDFTDNNGKADLLILNPYTKVTEAEFHLFGLE